MLAIGYAASAHVVNQVCCFRALGHDVCLLGTPARARPETRETIQAWLRYLLHPLRVVLAQLRS